MTRSSRKPILETLHRLADSPWFAYGALALLQVKVMLGIGNYRDLTPGDASSYFLRVFTWLDEGKVDIVWSPLYTGYLTILHAVLRDPFWVTVAAQVSIATCASLLFLALLRRLLSKGTAWLVAAWWALLPINFDTVYSVHLFSALFPLALFVVAAARRDIRGRGVVLAGLLLAALLVRTEYSLLFLLSLGVVAGYELHERRRGIAPPFRAYLRGYGLPLLAAALVMVLFYARSTHRYPELAGYMEDKSTIYVCQNYAYSRVQQGDPWQGDPWIDCREIVERDFGRPAVTLPQALLINPRRILENVWWNVKLIPAGTQLALFNVYSGDVNPDFMRAKRWSPAWLPLLAVLALGLFGAVRRLLIPGLRDGRPVENGFVWLLMLCGAISALAVMVMVRPRPSYMFPYAMFLMALAGLGMEQLFRHLRAERAVKALVPVAAVLLVLLTPSHYDAGYVGHFGQGGQGWREVYGQIAPHVDRGQSSSPSVIVTPVGNYQALCNYLGTSCRNLAGTGHATVPELLRSRPEEFREREVYVLYLEEMIWKFSSQATREDGGALGYVELSCHSLEGGVLACSDGRIDLDRGVMNDGSAEIPLRAALFVDDGYVIDQRTYPRDRGYFLQVLMKEGRAYLILVTDDSSYRTGFNQNYLLGRFDRGLFREAYNDYPAARLLRVRKPDPTGFREGGSGSSRAAPGEPAGAGNG